MTDTAIAESETEVADFPPSPIAEETLAALPELRYLFVDGMPVRPPTEAEKASYAARYADGTWADLNAPAEPHVILPPSDEVAELTAIAAGAVEQAAPPVLDEGARAVADAQVQHEAETTLARWTKGVRLAPPEATPVSGTPLVEGTVVSHDTQVLAPLPPEAQ